MENMQIKNLLLVVLFMSAQLFGSDRAEDLFGVDRAAINKGLVTVSALGVLAYIANSIRQVNQSRAVVIKEIVQSEVGTGVLANVNGVLSKADRGEKRAEGEESEILPVDSSRQESLLKTGRIRANSVNSGSLSEDEKSYGEEAVVALSPNILEKVLCEVMCEIVDNNLEVNFGSSESLKARYNVMRDRFYPNQTKGFSVWSYEMLKAITDINTEWNRKKGVSIDNLTQSQEDSILKCLLYNGWRKPIDLGKFERAVGCVVSSKFRTKISCRQDDSCDCQPVDQSAMLFSDFYNDFRIKETRLSKIDLCREFVRGAHVEHMLPITLADEIFYNQYCEYRNREKKEVADILKPLEKLDASIKFGKDQLKYVIVKVSRIPGLTMSDFAQTVEDYCAEYPTKEIGSSEYDDGVCVHSGAIVWPDVLKRGASCKSIRMLLDLADTRLQGDDYHARDIEYQELVVMPFTEDDLRQLYENRRAENEPLQNLMALFTPEEHIEVFNDVTRAEREEAERCSPPLAIPNYESWKDRYKRKIEIGRKDFQNWFNGLSYLLQKNKFPEYKNKGKFELSEEREKRKNYILACLLHRDGGFFDFETIKNGVKCCVDDTVLRGDGGRRTCYCPPLYGERTELEKKMLQRLHEKMVDKLFYGGRDDSWQQETERPKDVLCSECVRSTCHGYMSKLTTEEENFYTTYPYKALVACILKPLGLSEEKVKYVVVSLSRIPGLTMGDLAKTVEDYCAEYPAEEIGSSESD